MRNISINKDKVVYWAALVTITIVFYVINVLTPLWGDDWHYGFIIDGENWTVKRISSVNEYISTLYNHYLFVNGRGLPDVLQQFWGILESKLFFNICNSLVFFICFYLLSTTFSRGVGNYKEKFKILAISLFSIVVISSGFKETHLW